jgi:signal transduction histidine kinase
MLDIVDTGCGIREELQARIFEPFYSTRSGGTGLGLSTTRKIIEAHGGSLELQSEPSRGSKFTVRLPAAPVVDDDHAAP